MSSVGPPAPAQPPPRFFDPERILRVLDAHHVVYVLVGGLAATLRGSPTVTYDVDVTAESRAPICNASRTHWRNSALCATRIPTPPWPSRGLMSSWSGSSSSPPRFGSIDVIREIRAVGGYERLDASADDIDVAGITVRVAALTT